MKQILISILCFAFISIKAQVEVKSGTYIGDGIDNRSISGLGFQPDVVIIKMEENTSVAIIRTSSMSGDVTKPLVGFTGFTANMIQTLDIDGFTIGTDASVNGNTNHYHWMAFKAVNGEMSVGTYTGDGAMSHTITITGSFQPDYLYILPANTEWANYYSSLFTGSSYPFRFFGGTCINCVTGLTASGFILGDGLGSGLNTNTIVYHYVAWKQVSGKMKVSSYVGNGIDNTNVTGLGFTPEIVAIFRNNERTYFHSKSISADTTLSCMAEASFADGIQTLQTDGFQVGTSSAVNTSGTTYPFAAWGTLSGLPVKLLSFTASCDENTARINWKTASESNNDYFIIERAVFTTKEEGLEFIAIGTVKGVGNSSTVQHYEFADRSPSILEERNGQIFYYRLKQTDFDGNFEYFNPVTLNCFQPTGSINIYPNPFITQTIFTVSDSIKTTAVLEIYDLSGKEVRRINFSGDPITVKRESLASGIYFYKIISAGNIISSGKLMVNPPD